MGNRGRVCFTPPQSPPHTKPWLWETESQFGAETLKVRLGESLCEDIRNIVRGADACNVCKSPFNKIACGVIFDTEMFHIGMIRRVFCKSLGSIIVAVERSR